MKFNLLLVFSISIFLFSCEEDELPVTSTSNPALLDTTYMNSPVSAKQDKNVLLEEYTGVRCPNCPHGHEVLNTLLSVYGKQLTIVSIHDSSQFLQAVPFNDINLSTSWAKQIFTIYSKPGGLPYAIMDRMNGSINTGLWDNQVSTRLQISSSSNVETKILSFNSNTLELRYEVKFELTEDMNETLAFRTVITEDRLIGKQDTVGKVLENYVQNHILRDMPQFAEPLNPGNNPPALKGRVFIKQFSYTLKPDWNIKNCHLIAFIHKPVEVLQTAEIPIQ
ncbi:MAG: Omp28-related outer membrane protein [Bacteroidetes bacterium]|nr:Omp28-related outer membrane protein [Bacteroidota bacterium]